MIHAPAKWLIAVPEHAGLLGCLAGGLSGSDLMVIWTHLRGIHVYVDMFPTAGYLRDALPGNKTGSSNNPLRVQRSLASVSLAWLDP